MKISVVIPVYNTEKQVSRCIDSIRAQSYPDWELILVDDGSTDGSLNVLRDYEKKDSRIKVIYQDNAGPGLARNTGIKQASGNYLVFVDSDDVIKPDYFEKLSKQTEDVVFIDIDQVDEKFTVLQQEHMSDYQSLSKDDFIRGQMTGKILWGGVRKAAKLSLIKNYGILFSEHKIGEEAIYSFLLMHYANSFSFINGSVYEYVNRSDSQSHQKSLDPWGGVALALKDKIISMGLYEEYADTLNAFFTTVAIVSLDKIALEYGYSEYKSRARDCFHQWKKRIDSRYSIDTDHMLSKAKILYPLLRLHCFALIFAASRLRTIIKNN